MAGAGKRLWIGLALWLLASPLVAQQPVIHYEHAGVLVPGAIGSRQLQRGGPLPGYFQPVEIQAPTGASVSLAESDQFTQSMRAPVKAGMLIGSVYRLKVTGIPRREGVEVFPTIEVVDRLYPPVGQEARFPIPVEISLEDLFVAIDGGFVTRVIYLEDPKRAAPLNSAGQPQSWFEVGPHDDPLAVAEQLGRPMAILRIGGRVPLDSNAPGGEFMYHSPPLQPIAEEPAEAETVEKPQTPQPIHLRDRSQPTGKPKIIRMPPAGSTDQAPGAKPEAVTPPESPAKPEPAAESPEPTSK